MLKIGDFAHQGQVSVKTLRHYSKLGLLKPAWIDRFTGYRYYQPEQLARLNQILAMKELGFSLSQIGRLLQDDLSVEELRGMLKLKQAELAQRIQIEQERLDRVEGYLQSVTLFKTTVIVKQECMTMQPKIETKPAFKVAGLMYHGKNQNNEIPQLWEQLIPRINELRPLKPGLGYGVCGQPNDDGAFDYLAGFEVTQPGELPAGMTTWDVPSQTYAVFPCTLQTIGKTYDYILNTWMKQAPYRFGDGPDFEFYPAEFGVDNEDMFIYIPVVKV